VSVAFASILANHLPLSLHLAATARIVLLLGGRTPRLSSHRDEQAQQPLARRTFLSRIARIARSLSSLTRVALLTGSHPPTQILVMSDTYPYIYLPLLFTTVQLHYALLLARGIALPPFPTLLGSVTDQWT